MNCHLGDLQFLEISNPMIKRLRFGGSAISSENFDGSSIGGNDRVWCFLCWPFGPIDFGCFGHGQKFEDESRTTQIVSISTTKSVLSIFDAQFSSWVIDNQSPGQDSRVETEVKAMVRTIEWCVPLRLGSSIFQHFLAIEWR